MPLHGYGPPPGPERDNEGLNLSKSEEVAHYRPRVTDLYLKKHVWVVADGNGDIPAGRTAAVTHTDLEGLWHLADYEGHIDLVAADSLDPLPSLWR